LTDQIIVTGGLGFIGSNFIHRLLRSSHENLSVTNIDNESLGSNHANLQDISDDKRYRFVKGDLADYEFTRRILKNAKIIVNFAAQTHVDRSIANAEPFFESNTRAVFNLVRAANEAKIDRLVHISTDEVYGSIDNGSFDEESSLNPSSPYSATKAAADLIVRAWAATYSLRTVIVRCTNNFGPWQHPEKFIPKAIIRSLQGKSIPVYGGGTQIRDWIYVDDFCAAIELTIEKGDPGQIYNISAGNELSNRDLAQRLLQLLDMPSAELVEVDDRPGHDFRYSLNSEKARRQLGWKPETEFHDALIKTVNWYRQHTSWWRRLATEKVLSDLPWKEKW